MAGVCNGSKTWKDEFGIRNSEFGMPPIAIEFEFRISNFEFAVPNPHPPPEASSLRGAVAEGLVTKTAPGILPGRGT